MESTSLVRLLWSIPGQAIFKYTSVRALRRWAALGSFSACLHLATGHSSKQPFQFLDLAEPLVKTGVAPPYVSRVAKGRLKEPEILRAILDELHKIQRRLRC